MRTRLVIILLLAGFAGYSIAEPALLGFPLAFAQDKQSEGQKQGMQSPAEKISLEMASDLQKKQEELAKREERLIGKEAQLRAIEQDIDKKIEEFKRVQQKLEELVKIRDDLDAKNVATLIEAYSSMPPADAAARLKTMDRGIALKILMAMTPRKSSKILSNFDPATAAQFSEQLAKRQVE